MNPLQLKKIEAQALGLGFDAVGWTNDLAPQYSNYFCDWIKDKKYGDMRWFERTAEQRLDPTKIDSNIKSALVLLTSYNHNPNRNDCVQRARYAFGEDYHEWIAARLARLVEFIKKEIDPNFEGRSSVDTAPIFERDLAVKAGLGWIGKNTCLIHPKLGSFVLISVILLNCHLSQVQGQRSENFNLRPSTFDENHCGSCTKCLNACPTQALKPHQLHQQRCLAYQANAKKGERDKKLWSCFGESILGCDLCQNACPWNIKAPKTQQKDWLATFDKYAINDLSDLLQMTETEFKERFKGSVFDRSYIDLMRNVFLVIAFQKRVDLLDAVEVWWNNHKATHVAECIYCIEVLRSKSKSDDIVGFS